jgi:hypothetical protein
MTNDALLLTEGGVVAFRARTAPLLHRTKGFPVPHRVVALLLRARRLASPSGAAAVSVEVSSRFANGGEALMSTRVVRRGLVTLGVSFVAVVAMAGIASASQPDGPATGASGQFLCPAVGQGVPHATGTLASGQQTFLPGNNQAGAHVNANALNTDNPGTTAGPGGGNSDWSPLWPGEA